MATTTPNFGWSVPTSTDYVKDGATAIEALGDAIDATVGNVGLFKISTTSFTGVGSQSLANASFSSAYENYKIVITFSDATADGQIFFKLRASGTDSSAGYSWGAIGRSMAGSLYNNYASSIADGFFLLNADAGQPDITSAEITLFNPQLARKTKYISNAAGAESAGNITSFFSAGSHSATTAYDSITFYNAGGGDISGKVTVYGYKF
jgi:hypothetical protein